MKEFLLGLFGKRPAQPPLHPSAQPANSVTSDELDSFGARVRLLRPVDVGSGRFDQEIVGESQYQDALRKLAKDAFVTSSDRPMLQFLLVREPENSFDKNAIAVTTDTGAVVGYLSRADALALQAAANDHEQRGEVMRCLGTLYGDQQIGVWLNLPHLKKEAESSTAPAVSEHADLAVCREMPNVAELLKGRRPYSRSRPNWAGSRVAAIGEEKYTANLEQVSRGRCENGERITFTVLLVPDVLNPVDPASVVVTTKKGDVVGYLSKGHAVRWGAGIRAFFDSGRVVCRDARLHQRTFKGGRRQFYLAIEMTDEDWLQEAASRISND